MRFVIFLFVILLIQSHKNHDEVLGDIVQENYKSLAFEVLSVKCNTCHVTKKRTDVFTLENMDSLAPDIRKQVFIKKKMPKGRKIKLTEKESKALKGWLEKTLGTYN